MKTSKIKKILGNSQWKNSYGDQMYTVGVELENGDKGGINTKKADAYKEGDEINYEIEPSKDKEGKVLEGKFKIKVIKDNKGFQKNFGKPVDNEFQVVSFAYSYSKDLVVAGKIEASRLPEMANNIVDAMWKKYKSLKGE